MSACAVPAKPREWVHLRDVLRELIVRDFKLRYKKSLLGVAWSLLVPIAQLVVMYVVFHKIIPLNIPHYTTFLFTGILPWTWFQSSLLASSGIVVDNRELVKEVGFPAAILPPVTVISQLIHYLLALPILAVFLVLDGYRLGLAIVALPLVVLVQFAFTLSLAYIAATLQVPFRDTQYLLGIVLFLFFYLTPVFYDGGTLPADYQRVYQLNPMVHLLASYRSIFIRGEWPAGLPLLVLAILSAAILWLGYRFFMRARDQFVEEL
jgi:lipopolysaccharide transport system permease protein